MASLREAEVQRVGQRLAVQVLADEDQLLHAVTVLRIPICSQDRILCYHRVKLLLGHGGVPLSGILKAHLLAGLLKQVADIKLIGKIAHTLGADNTLRPAFGYKPVKTVQVHGLACIIDISAYTVFLNLTSFMVMMMVVMMVSILMMVFLLVIMLIIIIVIVMVMVVFMFIVVVIIVIIKVFKSITAFLNLLNPGGACGNVLKVKEMCVQYAAQVDVTVIALQYACARLQGANDLADALHLLCSDLRCFVEQYDIAEFNLLYYQILKILLADVLLHEVIAATELVTYAK